MLIDISKLLDIGAGAFEVAIAAVSKYGGAKAGFRTLLDALIPASSILKEVRNYSLLSPFCFKFGLKHFSKIKRLLLLAEIGLWRRSSCSICFLC